MRITFATPLDFKNKFLAEILHDYSFWRHPFPETLLKTALDGVEIPNRDWNIAGTMLLFQTAVAPYKLMG